MPAIQCHIASCMFATPDVDGAVAAVMVGHHLSSAHPVPFGKKAPVILPPKVTGYICEGMGCKDPVGIMPEKLPVYLMTCCDPDLKSSVEKSDPGSLRRVTQQYWQL